MKPAPLIILARKACVACANIEQLDIFLRESDRLVAKALALPEVVQMARIEQRARELLYKKWTVRANQAAKSAAAVVRGGGSVKGAAGAVDAAMKQWKGDVSAGYQRNVEDVYRLGRRAGWKKATGKTKASLQYNVPNFAEQVQKAGKSGGKTMDLKFSFDVKDEHAIDALQSQEMIWIGDAYKNVAPTIREALTTKLVEGLSKEAAGAIVEDTVAEKLATLELPEGYTGSAIQYFEGLAANAVTNARVQGTLTSFANIGIERYELVNPMDDRTTEQCAELNGTSFLVGDAMDQIAALNAAGDPDEYKAIKPWLGSGKLSELLGKGAKALSEAGQLFPPFHFRCRTTVDVAEESLTYGALAGD